MGAPRRIGVPASPRLLIVPPDPPLFEEECGVYGCVASRDHSHPNHTIRLVDLASQRVFFFAFPAGQRYTSAELLELAKAAPARATSKAVT